MLTDEELSAMDPDDRDAYEEWLEAEEARQARAEAAAELAAEYERIM